MTDDTASLASVEGTTRGVRFPRFPLCPDLRPRNNPRACCLRPEKPPKRPDPGIYSQVERYAAGVSTAWDSPDITTNLSGRTTLDENVRVTVRNYSPDAPALNTQVRLEYSHFGIGFGRSLLGIQPVSLNKAGLAQEEQTLDFYLPTAIRDKNGNISVFVTVSHPKDRYARNNEGEQAWSASAATAGSTATFDFELHNALASSTTFDLLTLEADWSAALSDSQVVLAPGQTRNLTLSVQVPADASGSRRFNIVALVGGAFMADFTTGSTPRAERERNAGNSEQLRIDPCLSGRLLWSVRRIPVDDGYHGSGREFRFRRPISFDRRVLPVVCGGLVLDSLQTVVLGLVDFSFDIRSNTRVFDVLHYALIYV